MKVWHDWNGAVKNSYKGIPGSKQLRNSIQAWEQNHPEDALKKAQPMKTSSLEDTLKNNSVTLKEICLLLAKQDLANVSDETKDELIEKIQKLLHTKNEKTKAA